MTLTRDFAIKQSLIDLLEDIEETFRRYIFVGDREFVTLALYVVHSHAIERPSEAVEGQYPYHTPYLNITSPTPSCGKTRMLEVLNLLVGQPWLTGMTTAAALVRKIENEQPTLLLDETDSAFKGDKDYATKLTGILNLGYSRSGTLYMCEGQGSKQQATAWHVFCPKVFAGIGREHLPDTLISRSIPIEMQRKVGASVEKFRELEAMRELKPVRQQCEALAPQLIPALKDARPKPAPDLSDRAEDVWDPLLAIADMAGGRWPALAREAATQLSGTANRPDADIGVQLLRDVHEVWPTDTPFISTMDLLHKLTALVERPWETISRGNPMKARKLAHLLKEFQIFSRSNGEYRGYDRDRFNDAWLRYGVTSQGEIEPSIRHVANKSRAG